jgi:hypothetical protein
MNTQKCKLCKQQGHNKTTCSRSKKRCSCCKNNKDIKEFNSNGSKGYLRSRCKSCEYTHSTNKHFNNLRYRLSQLLGSAKWRSTKKNIEFDLSLDYLHELYNKQNGICPYTGQKLTLEPGHNGLSLDRINPLLGYIRSNVILTSWKVNQMKTDLSIKEFVLTCKDIVNYIGANDEIFDS